MLPARSLWQEKLYCIYRTGWEEMYTLIRVGSNSFWSFGRSIRGKSLCKHVDELFGIFWLWKLSYLPRKHVNTHPYHYRSFSKLLLQSSKFAVSPIPYKIDPEAEGPLKYSTRWPTDIGSLGICTHPKPGYHATSIDISPDLGVSSCGHPATSKGQLLSAMLTCISDRCQCLSCQLYMACVTNLLGGRVGNILRLPRHKIICKIIMIPGCNLQQTAGNCTTSRLGYIHHVGTMWASTALQLQTICSANPASKDSTDMDTVATFAAPDPFLYYDLWSSNHTIGSNKDPLCDKGSKKPWTPKGPKV